MTIGQIRLSEQEVRDALSNVGIEKTVKMLFPDVSDDFVKSNRFFPNKLQRASNRYVSAMTRGQLSWEWDAKATAPTTGTPDTLLAAARELLQAATVDAMCSGKFGFFPYIDDQGQLHISALSGFLWPVFRLGNSTMIDALLQITSYRSGQGFRFEVRRYSPGLLEVYTDLTAWESYATAPKMEYRQPHALNRLPVAFRISGRDANRHPEGIGQTALPAFYDYVKARVMMSFITEMGGFEERVFASDKLLELAKSNPNDPVLVANKKVGPRQIKLVGSGDKYDRLSPVPLAEYQARAEQAASDVDDAMNIPNVDGTKLAGVALQEKREAYTETVGSLAGLQAEALTEALDLAALLQPRSLVRGWRVTITPRFTQDTDKERTAIREDYKAGVLPKSAALSGLQGLGVTYVTDDLVEQAQAVEALDAPLPPDDTKMVTGGG